MTIIVAPPSNASKWQMGFNSAFKGLNSNLILYSKSLWCSKTVTLYCVFFFYFGAWPPIGPGAPHSQGL